MNYRLALLRVKIKSLAAEQDIIRHEKRRAMKSLRYAIDKHLPVDEAIVLVDDLQAHRLHHVRPEIRVALIAYGLLRGRTLEQIEPRAKRPYDKKRVDALITKYGDRESRQRLLNERSSSTSAGRLTVSLTSSPPAAAEAA